MNRQHAENSPATATLRLSRPPEPGSPPNGITADAAGWIALMHALTLLSRRLRGLLGSRRDCPTLGETDLLVIWVCASDRADGVSQSQLAAGLGVSAAQISALVERLRQAGLIVGRRDGADRRRQLWQLTAAGRSAWETALAEVQRAVEPLAARLGRSRGEHLRRALTALVAELDAAARCAASAACAAGEDPAREAA